MLEPEENLASKILAALREAAPAAQVDLARNLVEAQRLVMNDRPDLFVLDVDAVPDLGQDFLYDLRTSHPNARAIVLTGVHLAAYLEPVLARFIFLKNRSRMPTSSISSRRSFRPRASRTAQDFRER